MISTSTAADFVLKFRGLSADRTVEFHNAKFKAKFHTSEFRDANSTEQNFKTKNSTI
ncbi:hypothetical protein [uncultured Campylobacter sp.]|uniref:hypothetical protein n=1 Tax=uncultured Campylobacter sp. TaxID=218934 RepID=UPI0026222695|nr:hypothetical protein [uncultured Campylobacter sp.]